MRLASALLVLAIVGCGSSSDDGGSTSSSSSSSGGTSAKPQLRYKNTTGTTWQAHVTAGHAQVSGFSYTIVMGAFPTPARFVLSTLADGQATD